MLRLSTFSLVHPERRRGVVLPVAIILCTIAAVSSLYLVYNLMDHQRLNQRRFDMGRAYFAAEAGVMLVKYWGNNNPNTYDPDSGEEGLPGDSDSLFYRNLTTGGFPNLEAALGAGNIVVDSAKLPTFTSKHGYEVSSIQSITLMPPDPGTDPTSCTFKVLSVGQTPSGVERSVLAYMDPNPLTDTDLALPAALMSLNDASQTGNGVVHWGEAWTKGDFDMIGASHVDHLDHTDSDYDPWAKYRSEGTINFPSTYKDGSGKDVFTTNDTSHANYHYPGLGAGAITGFDDSITSGGVASGDYGAAFEHHLPDGTLEWPDFRGQYQDFKTLAMEHGRYYSTDADGNIYRDGIEDADHLVDFVAEFEKEDRINSFYDLVFIDTVDGNPPAADNSNLADISSTGVVKGLKGVFYLCANFEVGGSGQPDDLTGVEKPDGSTADLTAVYLDGVLYASGVADMQGNPVIFGSVVTDAGFASGGTPEIYYNHKLKDGLEIPKGNIGSVFSVVLQDNQ